MSDARATLWYGVKFTEEFNSDALISFLPSDYFEDDGTSSLLFKDDQQKFRDKYGTLIYPEFAYQCDEPVLFGVELKSYSWDDGAVKFYYPEILQLLQAKESKFDIFLKKFKINQAASVYMICDYT